MKDGMFYVKHSVFWGGYELQPIIKTCTMKTTKLLFGIILSACFFCTSSLFAQKNTCYKGVCIMRGEHKPGHSDAYGEDCGWTNNCVYVENNNSYEAVIQFDYKLEDRESPWRHCSWAENNDHLRVPAKDCQKWNVSHIPSYLCYSQLRCFDGEIKALRLTYVDILKPSVGDEIMKVFFGDNNENN